MAGAFIVYLCNLFCICSRITWSQRLHGHSDIVIFIRRCKSTEELQQRFQRLLHHQFVRNFSVDGLEGVGVSGEQGDGEREKRSAGGRWREKDQEGMQGLIMIIKRHLLFLKKLYFFAPTQKKQVSHDNHKCFIWSRL